MRSPGLVVLLSLALPFAAAGQEDVKRVERGNLVMEGIPEIPDDIKDRLSQYLKTRTAGFADWNPRGGILMATRFGNTYQLHQVDRPMGAQAGHLFPGAGRFRPIRPG